MPTSAAMRRLFFPLLGCCLAVAVLPARAADPIHYKIDFPHTGDGELDGLLKQTSALLALQKKLPPAPFALIGRARTDAQRFISVLHALGYDNGQVVIDIDHLALTDPALLAQLNQLPATQDAEIEIKITKGSLFTLNQIDITGLPAGFKPNLRLHAGQVARAAPILNATTTLTNALRNAGYAFATVSQPYALANRATNQLDIRFSVTPGPRVDIGTISFSGVKHTQIAFLQRHIGRLTGQPYALTTLQNARNALLGLGIFSSVTPVTAPEAIAGQVPVDFRVTEMKRHTISLTGAYATDTGFALETGWKDRNLFGHAESLSLSSAVSGIAGNSTSGLGYDVKAAFAKPDYYARGQTLNLTAEALKESLTAYDRKGILLGGSLSRPITTNTSISFGPNFINEKITQQGVSRTYVLAQFPISFNWNTANSVLEPTRGHKLNLSLTPTYPVVGQRHRPFIILLGTGSLYLPVERKDRGVLALHGVVGSVQGTSQFNVPPDQRFYGGGSGTIRGYSYQTVGPLFADDKPQGGLAIDALNVEFRQHITKTIGIVPFIDAGQVNAGSRPFKGTVRVGYGLGLRYYTGIGPIRVDLAFPVKRTAGSGAFALYIGLGEAF